MATTYPTLDSDWTPINPSACPSSTDYWQWDYGSGSSQDTVLGGPSQTTNGCLPTGWEGQKTYLAAQCPPSYSLACGGQYDSAYTCCPTTYMFSCVSVSTFTDEMAPTFRCKSQFTSSTAAAVTHWDIGVRTTDVGIRNLTSANHLFALGIVYVTPTSSTSSSSPSSSKSQSFGSPSGSESLTVGASAGVGIGVACGIVLVAALVGWFIYRRKFLPNHSRHSGNRNVTLGDEHGGGAVPGTGHNGGGVKVNNPVGTTQLFELPQRPAELH